MTRTFGAAIGALIFILFMATIAASLGRPASASPRAQSTLSQR